MSIPMVKKPNTDTTRIGDMAAMQPLSGIARVNETGAVNGLGHGAFVREGKTDKLTSKH